MHCVTKIALFESLLFGVASVQAATFEPTQFLGGNSPWFPGPDVNNIPYEVPQGCSVDTAAFVSRHGSRYPDPGAYKQWTDLAAKIHAASFSASDELAFIENWEPVLRNPAQELQLVSPGGWRELYDMGVTYRQRYPDFYTENTPFSVFANQYTPAPRVIDSARLFARGYLGPNSTYGDVYVLKSNDPRGVANSLGASDLCTTYKDNGAGPTGDTWNNVYLPPVTARLNKLIQGNLNFTTSDVSLFPYLCGFETQITGRESPWCDVFTKDELRDYEYAQDLRYYYGAGPGSGKNYTLMQPVLNAIVQRLVDGPNKTYTNSNGESWAPNPLMAMFTNDGQLNQLAAELGVFDDQKPLPGNKIPGNRIYIASHFTSMRGTIGFERLSCSENQKYVRIVLNDAVYPVTSCKNGPGKSCLLSDYVKLMAKKQKAQGTFASVCNISNATGAALTNTATFLRDNALPWEFVVKP